MTANGRPNKRVWYTWKAGSCHSWWYQLLRRPGLPVVTWDSGGRHSANHLQLPSTAPAARTLKAGCRSLDVERWAERRTQNKFVGISGRCRLPAPCCVVYQTLLARRLCDDTARYKPVWVSFGIPLELAQAHGGGVQNPSLWSFVDCSRTKESVEPGRTPAIVAALCSSQPASTSERAIALTGWWGKTP